MSRYEQFLPTEEGAGGRGNDNLYYSGANMTSIMMKLTILLFQLKIQCVMKVMAIFFSFSFSFFNLFHFLTSINADTRKISCRGSFCNALEEKA
jgi:hypothetical protein